MQPELLCGWARPHPLLPAALPSWAIFLTSKLAPFLQVLVQLGDGRDCARSSWDCLNSFWNAVSGSPCFLFPKGKRGGVSARAQTLTAMGSKASGWLVAWCPDPGPDATLVALGPKSCLYEEYAQASVTFRDKPGFSQDGLPGMSPCCGSSGLPCHFHTRPCWCPNPSSFLPL